MGQNITKAIIAVALIFCTGIISNAQENVLNPKKNEVAVGNAKLSREKRELILDYDVALGQNVNSCVVDIQMYANGRLVDTDGGFTGDFGLTKKSGSKQVIYKITNSAAEELSGKEISFNIKIRNKDVFKTCYFALPNLSITKNYVGYGITVGCVRKVGGYLKFNSNFKKVTEAYSCDSSGQIADGGYIWTTGAIKKTGLSALGGVLFRAHKYIYPFFGAGYGYRNVYWGDAMGEWAKVTDYSHNGLAAEIGLMFKFGPVAISAGASTIMFKTVSAEVGIGVIF